jgi:CubicO group peptidase (beta-lactamase class C family)
VSRVLRFLGAASAAAATVVALTASTASAAPAAPPVATDAPAAHPLTGDDLAPWLDGLIPSALRDNQVPGAVVVVVKDGKAILSRGYGMADVHDRTPVDPARTLFRVASISKTLTWTAVMQLVENGQVDLDGNINDYLDFTVDGRNGEPITIRHLMTHTAGFEEMIYSPFLDDPSDLIPLERFVKRFTPERIHAPGTTPAYSNYGAALAGYIVQRVSGMPFDDYMDRKVLAPLGMTSSTFRQPLPTALDKAVAHGYRTATEPAQPFEYIWDAPAGSLSATGRDMGRFMVEHLGNERPRGGALLEAKTATLMHRTIRREFPDLNGMALGFYEANNNGHEVLAHSGDLTYFHSDMNLYLDDDVGIFVSYNGAGNDATDIRRDLMAEFGDRYFPGPATDPSPGASTAREHADEVAGSYLSSRRPESSFIKAGNLVGQVQLRPAGDGSLTVTGFDPPFVEIKPYLWRQVGSDVLLAVKSQPGQPPRIGVSLGSGIIVFERLPAYASTVVRGTAIIGSLALLALTLLSWPASAIIRRRCRVTYRSGTREHLAIVLRRVASALVLVSAAAWVPIFLDAMQGAAIADGRVLFTQILAVASCGIATILALASLAAVRYPLSSSFRLFTTLAWTAGLTFLLTQFLDLNLLRVGTGF